MSCDWNVHCVTCRDTEGVIYDANHAEPDIWELIRVAPALAAIGVASDELAPLSSTLERLLRLERDGVAFRNLAQWFARHQGHELVPIDEYGRTSTDCGEWGVCDGCDHTGHCRLPRKHEGPHKLKAAK